MLNDFVVMKGPDSLVTPINVQKILSVHGSIVHTVNQVTWLVAIFFHLNRSYQKHLTFLF